MHITIRPMKTGDWPLVRQIYQEGMETGNATFETEAPSQEAWEAAHLPFGRLVAESNGVIGWAALTPVSGRCVYAGVAEVSVYVSAQARGHGVGKSLLRQLIEESESHGLWTLQAGIFPENTPSIVLHEGMGFTTIGRRQRIGKMNGVWRDTLLLERRSEKVGL